MHLQEVGEVCMCVCVFAWCWLSLSYLFIARWGGFWCSWCRYCQSREPCHFSPCETFDLLQRLFSTGVFLSACLTIYLSVSVCLRLCETACVQKRDVNWSRSTEEWVETATLALFLSCSASLPLSLALPN